MPEWLRAMWKTEKTEESADMQQEPKMPACRKKLLMMAVTAVLWTVLIVSVWNLVGYGWAYWSSVKTSKEMRELYYQEEETVWEEMPVSAQVADDPAEEAELLAQAEDVLPVVKYPDNPYVLISSRFSRLRRQNEDIIGWIKIDDLLDEAVVQRDNTYYLKRDYKGYHNENGAIFLEEQITLRTRPYTLILYGHNMKTGRMFGGLRNYENLTYYHKNPFITFDTLYEEGRYVIFAVGNISTDVNHWRFVNWAKLLSDIPENRAEVINDLYRFSLYTKRIDVQPEDQILVLMTCVDDASVRRVVVARRIRPGETEEELLAEIARVRVR